MSLENTVNIPKVEQQLEAIGLKKKDKIIRDKKVGTYLSKEEHMKLRNICMDEEITLQDKLCQIILDYIN